MTKGDYYLTFMKGFRCGATGRGLDKACSEHADEGIRKAYDEGWHEGRAAAAAAAKLAKELSGYEPSVIRIPSPPEFHIEVTPRDWPEDFSYENGNYTNNCCRCKQLFVGHKRRVFCKECTNAVTETENHDKENSDST